MSCADILSTSNNRLNFAICPGNSLDWSDYIILKNHYKDMLAERKLEKTNTTDNLTFSAVCGRWQPGCNINLYNFKDNTYNEITSGFSINRIKGNITFDTAQTDPIFISIAYPNYFRVGIQIMTSTNSMFQLYSMGLMYTKQGEK